MPSPPAQMIIAGAGSPSTRHGGISDTTSRYWRPSTQSSPRARFLYSIVQMPAGIPVATVAMATPKRWLVSSANSQPTNQNWSECNSNRQSLAESVMEKQRWELGAQRYLDELL